MSVLVWLTQTTTGDLDELHLTNLNHAFFSEIAHRGTNFLARNQSFYEQDFVRFLERKSPAEQFFDCRTMLFSPRNTKENAFTSKKSLFSDR